MTGSRRKSLSEATSTARDFHSDREELREALRSLELQVFGERKVIPIQTAAK